MGLAFACGVEPAATSTSRAYHAWPFVSDMSSIWYLADERRLGAIEVLT